MKTGVLVDHRRPARHAAEHVGQLRESDAQLIDRLHRVEARHQDRRRLPEGRGKVPAEHHVLIRLVIDQDDAVGPRGHDHPIDQPHHRAARILNDDVRIQRVPLGAAQPRHPLGQALAHLIADGHQVDHGFDAEPVHGERGPHACAPQRHPMVEAGVEGEQLRLVRHIALAAAGPAH